MNQEKLVDVLGQFEQKPPLQMGSSTTLANLVFESTYAMSGGGEPPADHHCSMRHPIDGLEVRRTPEVDGLEVRRTTGIDGLEVRRTLGREAPGTPLTGQ